MELVTERLVIHEGTSEDANRISEQNSILLVKRNGFLMILHMVSVLSLQCWPTICLLALSIV